MHARELLNLAELLTWQGPILAEHRAALPAGSLARYWAACKCRLDRWDRELIWLRENFTTQPGFNGPGWRAIQAVCDEILTGEILSRLWAAIMCLHDRHCGQTDGGPIARGILNGHITSRQRVLELILDYQGVGPHEGQILNRLRWRCERWTDVLLARLQISGDVAEFAHDAARLIDFKEEWPTGALVSAVPQARAAWLLASFRATFQDSPPPATANADLNRQIAESLLSCFPPEAFCDSGTLRTLWEARLIAGATDAERLVGQLQWLDRPATAPATSFDISPRARQTVERPPRF
ncbi:MAG: hypothetical protein SFX18_07850 [Pirellulales bacterium]|nr:hypothetical protein [Pirellulales bacterium]